MLHAGAWLRVAAGEAWVVEGWPSARLELIELAEPPPPPRPGVSRESRLDLSREVSHEISRELKGAAAGQPSGGSAAGASAASLALRPGSWWRQAWASVSIRLPKPSHSFLL